MMNKVTRPLLFLYSFLFSMMILVLTLYAYFYSRNQKKWLLELIQTKLFYLPLIVYVILISLMVAGVVTLISYFAHRSQYGKIEEKVHLLASGNYESHFLTVPIPSAKDDEYVPDIDEDIGKVRVKLLEMSKELQVLSARPQLLEGESKEEILEQERHRLARELHDSVSQQLFAAMMMLSALNEQADRNPDVSETYRKQLQMVGTIINSSQSEMRALLLHLRPTNLEGKSLKQGIQQLLIELQSKIQIHLTWDIAEVNVEKNIEDNLFRIVQELLSNTLRHAKAKELEVYLNQTDQIVILRMVDDGVGFDTTDEKIGSYGLKNIHERVTSLGGLCKIISFKNQGTSVEIRIPVIKEEELDDKSVVSG